MDKEWEVGGETVHGEVIERIDVREMPFITVPGCKHENTSSKPSSEFPGYKEITCDDCPIGWYVSASTTE